MGPFISQNTGCHTHNFSSLNRQYVSTLENTVKSLMNLSLLLQKCPKCLVHVIWKVLEVGGKLLNSCCFMGCCFQNSFNIACGILVWFLSCFSSISFVHVVHPYSSIDTTTVWKEFSFNLLDRSDFLMIYSQSIAIHIFTMLLLMYVNFSTNF